MIETIVVIAKRPVPGRVKTRLVPPLTPTEAATLASAALIDTLRAVEATPARRRVLAFDGPVDGWLPAGWTLLRAAIRWVGPSARRCVRLACRQPAVLVGMDTPQLQPHHLTRFDPREYDACLGPAADGGYWAIGFRNPSIARSAIEGIPMSSDRTAAEQLNRLAGLGLSVQLLDELIDVDTIDDAVSSRRTSRQLRVRHTVESHKLGRVGELMQPGALQPYERALLTREPLRLHHDDGRVTLLEVSRWLGAADSADHTVLSRALAPVLDVGCGPGRIVAASTARGMLTLGIDIADTAVSMTRARGMNALRRDVFAPFPARDVGPA